MHHHINHCWCSMAEHTGEFYDAPNMVEINKLDSDKDDWDRLIGTKQVISEEDLKMFKRMKEVHPVLYANRIAEKMAEKDCPILKDEVIAWLNDNIKLQKNGESGWAMGNDQYRMVQTYQLTLWFQRTNDAKKFIKTWSTFKKATSYFNYFDDPITNLVLDIKTSKYNDRHQEE